MSHNLAHQMVLAGVVYPRIPPDSSAILVDLVETDPEGTVLHVDSSEPELLARFPSFAPEFAQAAIDEGQHVSMQAVRQGPVTITLQSGNDAAREIARLRDSGGRLSLYPLTLWILPRGAEPLEREAAEHRTRGEAYPAILKVGGVSVTIHGSAFTTTSFADRLPQIRNWINRAAGNAGTAVEWRKNV